MFRSTSCLVVLVLVGVGPVSAQPVEWPIASGGNGHYYESFGPSRIRWTEAKLAAENSTFQGTAGHLATITSQGEWDFVLDNFPHDLSWIGLSDARQEGLFEWITGEPFTFTAWLPGEPNDDFGEDYVHYHDRPQVGWGWNDYGNRNQTIYGQPLSYLVEYPVPEPSTLVLLSMGAVGLLLYAWRRRKRTTN